MYYNANGDSSGNKPKWRWFERIGMAVSDDMINWRYGADPLYIINLVSPVMA
jgi:hypothetical protein